MRRIHQISAAAILFSFIPTGLAYAQSSAQPKKTPWEGEVTGRNVYVRSGAGTRYYPTTKLNTGDRVLVLDEKFGWYRIVPPTTSFSYIDMALVGRVPGTDRAIVKQDRVFVRAGSHLVSRKSATQVVLNRGREVRIIGEADGFYKIKPPRGASLYISKQYVRRVPERLRTGLLQRYLADQQRPADAHRTPLPGKSQPAGFKPGPAAASLTARSKKPDTISLATGTAPGTTGGTPAVTTGGMGGNDNQPIQVDSTIVDIQQEQTAATSDLTKGSKSASPTGDVKKNISERLAKIEADLQTTMRQSPDMRDLDALVRRYQEIVVQTHDPVTTQYAGTRIGQLKNLIEIRRARTRFAAAAEDIDAYRAQMNAERMRLMRARAEAALVKYDLEGELRQSYAFAPEKHRYRLVDPGRGATIAYVDIPRDLRRDAEHLVGRLVGIRVAGRRYSQAARIPIAVAAGITDLTPRKAAALLQSSKSAAQPNTPAKLANTNKAAGEKGKQGPAPQKTANAAGGEEQPDQ